MHLLLHQFHLLCSLLVDLLLPSGGSRIFERGVQVQADYIKSMDCFIMAGEYVKFSEFWTFEIASAGFSGPIQRALVRRSSKLLHLFHCPCRADSFLLLMACQTYYDFTVTMPTNFYHTAFVIKRICSQN